MHKPGRKALLWGVAGGGIMLAAAGLYSAKEIRAGLAGLAPQLAVGASDPLGRPVALLGDVSDEDLASGRYALVLGDFVTGAGPRLITDPDVLQALRPSLWYLEGSGGGYGAEGSALTKEGATGATSAVTEIGALLKDGKTVRSFTCLRVQCGTWPTGLRQGQLQGQESWGMGGLRDSLPTSAPAELITSHFENYDAYLINHEAIAADPGRWFAEIGGEALLPPDTGLRRIHIDLPSELVALHDPIGQPPGMLPPETLMPETLMPETPVPELRPSERQPPGTSPQPRPEDEAARLADQAQAWIGDGPGKVTAVRISAPMTFLVLQDGAYLTLSGQNRTLPGIGWRDRAISIELPEARLAEVTARIDTGFAPSPDLLRLGDAVHRAFESWGLDTSCLPGCGSADQSRIIQVSEVTVSPGSSWSITSWRVIPEDQDE